MSAFGVGISFSAAATYNYNYFDVLADPGTYGPISLGDDINLNACGSTFHRADGSSESYSICDLSNLQDFTLGWVAYSEDSYQILSWYEGSNVANGLETTVSTGTGTFFSDVGNYLIGLYVAVAGDTYVPLPYGSYGATGNDTDLAYDGSTNTSGGFSNTFAVSEVYTPVPEPMAALMLLPGFILIARRERRRRANAKTMAA
ncbi:hypothetical protein [Kordiimonas aestuarii]|uniref:hypothetical protein n=1 Tax=Kordiimonas aestuarii TaxID=1005925 RepID=UPI0021CE43BE|nr:hypothetical protein [Kordiimonas aestuarii]